MGRLNAESRTSLEQMSQTAGDLAEWNYGDNEGQRSLDICSERPNWNVFWDGCPYGESPAQISDRADRLITQLAAFSGNVALFSYGQFGCVLGGRWIGLPMIDGQHLSLGPASLSTLATIPTP